MAAKAFGADRVAVAELNKDNLAAAQRAGADACVRTAPGEAPSAVAARMKQALPPHGPDVVIDCVGFESTTQVGQHYTCTALWQLFLDACMCTCICACMRASARARALCVMVRGCYMPPPRADTLLLYSFRHL